MNTSTTDPAGRTAAQLCNLRLCRLLKQVLDLRFNMNTQQFVLTAPGQVGGTEISENSLLVLISTTLAQQPEIFPPSHIRPRHLKQIIHLLRALCADAGEDAVQILQRFVETRIKLQPNSDLTSAEIRATYEQAAQEPGELTLSKHEFHRCLPGLIKRRFGKLKLHEIERHNKDGRLTKRNGWRGITLTDGTDKTDGTDTSLQNHSDNIPQPKDQPL